MKAIVPVIGEINEETVDTYLSIVNSTENLSELHFKIDSQGGFVQAADNIITHAKSLGVKIITEQIGKVMSAASKLMAIGDERIGNKGDEENIMIHLPRVQAPEGMVITSETASKLESMLTTIEEQFIDTYDKVITLGKDKIKKMMSKETFMTNKDALDIGLLTKINAKSINSKLQSFKPVAYFDVDQIESLTQTENKVMDQKEKMSLADEIMAMIDKRKEAKEAKAELETVKASNEDLTKELEEAKSVKAEADKKVEELEAQLKASEEAKEVVLKDASDLANIVKSYKSELDAYKAKEVAPADEEVAVKAEVATEEKPEFRGMSLMK